MDISGLLIRRERLRRDWSQEGVCRGICAVSYLSKVVLILDMLLGRLEVFPVLMLFAPSVWRRRTR